MIETLKKFGGKKLGGLILIVVIIIAFGFGGFGILRPRCSNLPKDGKEYANT